MNGQGQRPVIFCFRHDLRLSDNQALAAAAATGRPVLMCYVLDHLSAGNWRTGGAGRWWLHHSLAALQQRILDLGGRLVVREGDWARSLLQLSNETDACAVYWSRGHEPESVRAEQELRQLLTTRNIQPGCFPGYLLFAPEQIHTREGKSFKVFTPFWRACLQQPEPDEPVPVGTISFYQGDLDSIPPERWGLLPSDPDWSGGLRTEWSPGEAGARQRLNSFLETALARYQIDRDRPGCAGSSRLSPHLHFGEISPRQVWHAVRSKTLIDAGSFTAADAFLRELGWREFCSHLLYHWPAMPERPMRAAFADFPWCQDPRLIHLWQTGQTGFPLVDAGMRELWQSGWMHNRVRMIAASFLVKNLLQPWQAGEAWFWDTLVDADLANNAAGWQWVAGCGADAAPYFRIFNPVRQSQKFDPEGSYLRRWLPELARLPDTCIHAPWLAAEHELQSAGVCLGHTYPKPVVDLSASRERALNAYKRIKSKSGFP